MTCTIHPSQTVQKSTLISLLCCFTLLLISCEGPEVVERQNNYTQTNGDNYTLDIYMLAEWAGRIIPERNLATFNLKKADGKIFAKGYEDTDLSSVLKFDGSNNLFFYPYGTDSSSNTYSPAFACKSNSMTVPDSDGFQKYTCEIYRSGTDAIYNVWKNESEDSPNKSIYIGSGDNFGVSQPVSSKYGDYPAIQMLNKLGLTAETFGNHNFDYSLSDLQELIEAADFPFVISNFSNLPNNIEHTTSYTIVDIPPDDNEKGEKLHLAILGAFDHNAMDIISRGRFGTLTIDDYCPLINTMEEAFNKNARAFLILSHVFTDKSSIQEFFNGLFYFSQQFADAVDKVNNSNAKDKSLIENYPCTSHLIITQEMLDSYRQYLKGQKDSRANSVSVKDLRKAIYQQIFDNILMVFGEASFHSFLTPLYPGNEKSELSCPKQGEQSDPMIRYHINGCNNDASGENDQNTGIVNLFYNTSLFAAEKLPENIKLTEDEALKVLKFPKQEFEFSEAEGNDHPIWFAELSPKGYETAKATFHIKKVDTPIKSSASFYKSNISSFKRIPVFGKPYSTSSESAQKELTTYDDDHCTDYLSGLKECAKYFEGYKANTIDSNNKKPDIKFCRNELMNNKTLSISELENAWACIYYVTQWEYRKDDKKFINEPICSFGNYIIAGENKDNEIRKYSSFLTNFITDTFFRVMGDEIDAVYINAGNIRESRDFSIIDNEFLNMALPFSNVLVKLTLTVSELVETLELGLKADISGVFPAIAGLRLSYSLDKDRNPVIEELWQVSENKIDDSSIEYETGYGKEYYTPLYMSESTIKTKHCLFSAQKDGKCVFGEFNPTSKKLNQSKTITLLINSYMQSGGDNFPVYADTKYTIVGEDVLGLFKSVLKKDDETSLCSLYISDEKIYDTNYILTHNLIKRIYNVSEPYIGEFGYAMDYRGQICVATQQSLFDEIAASGSIESPPCNYSAAASNASGS